MRRRMLQLVMTTKTFEELQWAGSLIQRIEQHGGINGSYVACAYTLVAGITGSMMWSSGYIQDYSSSRILLRLLQFSASLPEYMPHLDTVHCVRH